MYSLYCKYCIFLFVLISFVSTQQWYWRMDVTPSAMTLSNSGNILVTYWYEGDDRMILGASSITLSGRILWNISLHHIAIDKMSFYCEETDSLVIVSVIDDGSQNGQSFEFLGFDSQTGVYKYSFSLLNSNLYPIEGGKLFLATKENPNDFSINLSTFTCGGIYTITNIPFDPSVTIIDVFASENNQEIYFTTNNFYEIQLFMLVDYQLTSVTLCTEEEYCRGMMGKVKNPSNNNFFYTYPNQTVVSYNLISKKINWIKQFNDNVFTFGAFSKDGILFSFGGTNSFAVDSFDGQIIWSYYHSKQNYQGAFLLGDIIYACGSRYSDGVISTIDSRNGMTIATSKLDPAPYKIISNQYSLRRGYAVALAYSSKINYFGVLKFENENLKIQIT